MSGNLAIAAVSAVMRYLLLTPLTTDRIANFIPDMRVSALSPSRAKDDQPTLNVFFYRAVANNGWSNASLPARNDRGERVTSPALALDLYYMISAHAKKDYQSEALIGYAMQTFHENPNLTRNLIRTALPSATLVTSDTPLGLLDALASSDLADQIELVKITPYYPTPEETANLWSVLNTAFVPAAYYRVALVLIESKRPTRPALPVQNYNLYALPFNQPRIQDVISVSGVDAPILSGAQVLLRGYSLRGENTQVTVGGIVVPPADVSVADDQIQVKLPAVLSAGVAGAQVSHLLNIGTPPVLHQGIESNVAAFVLQPAITKTGSNYNLSIVAAAGALPRRLRVSLSPAVGINQRVTLLLNEIQVPAGQALDIYTIDAPDRTAPATQLDFPIPAASVAAGTYLVRVRVDGAESPLDYIPADGYNNPKVTLT